MGYDVFKLGALYLGNNIQYVPKQPKEGGDIPKYDQISTLFILPAKPEESITWIKPHALNLFVADRVLLTNISWYDLNKNGFVQGNEILLGGYRFRCRLLRLGEEQWAPNEWFQALDLTKDDVFGDDDRIWHWDGVYFWGADSVPAMALTGITRGRKSSRHWGKFYAPYHDPHIGFRPVLEPLGFLNPISYCDLDGTTFRLGNLPGGEGFCPILQPMRENVFKDIAAGDKVKMYTFLEDGHPVHFGASIKDAGKLTLTDRYFGNEYLVPWTISNGVAVAKQAMQQQV